MKPAIDVIGLCKAFTLHVQGGARIPVFDDLCVAAFPGECLALHGPSGSGKSTLLRSLYANYKPQSGQILVRHNGGCVDMASAPPRQVLAVRKQTMGFVSQFLRVIPRVPALDIVGEPLLRRGFSKEEAERRAREMLARLNVPSRLWPLAPATFSGGEQQRVNVARGFIADYPILLLDEPTASLDARNRGVVLELIREAKSKGMTIVGIFHDDEVRQSVADRIFEMKNGK